MKKHFTTTILSRQAIGLAAILACCLGHSLHSALAAPGSWTRKSPMPMALDAHASCEVDGIIYLFGGSTFDGQTTYDLTLAYDPVQDKFTTKRRMPMPCEAAACASIDGKIYHSGGANQDPFVHPVGALYYNSLWVFDPQGGVTLQISGLTIESPDRVRLAWQGEAGRPYGVLSTVNPANPSSWARVMFSTGTNSILATNALVEATCPVSTGDTQRFFQVLEAN